MLESTLSIIKPDATDRSIIGQILARFEQAGLRLKRIMMLHLTKEQAEKFYEVHKERPFYNDLVASMIAAPVVVSILHGEDAVAKHREIMGATNPKDAAPGTIRKDFALSIEANSVHGSDSLENARTEVAFFFPDYQD